MKLRSLQNLTSRDIFLQKYHVNVSDIIVHLAEFSVSIFKRLQKKKNTASSKSGSAYLWNFSQLKQIIHQLFRISLLNYAGLKAQFTKEMTEKLF